MGDNTHMSVVVMYSFKNIGTLKIHIIIIKLFKIHWILFPLRKKYSVEVLKKS